MMLVTGSCGSSASSFMGCCMVSGHGTILYKVDMLSLYWIMMVTPAIDGSTSGAGESSTDRCRLTRISVRAVRTFCGPCSGRTQRTGHRLPNCRGFRGSGSGRLGVRYSSARSARHFTTHGVTGEPLRLSSSNTIEWEPLEHDHTRLSEARMTGKGPL